MKVSKDREVSALRTLLEGADKTALELIRSDRELYKTALSVMSEDDIIKLAVLKDMGLLEDLLEREKD
jgi:hypothetical protein|tara:strand:- start:713 stop:916 length:204 start_codon:yes stop_codon:yes gene_type:complete